MTALEDYFDALDRLKRDKPVNVPQGTSINNDTVALEAGRKRGAIKKSRPEYSQLILDIKEAGIHKSSPLRQLNSSLERKKILIAELEARIETLANQNLMLLEENHRLNSLLSKNRIVPINKKC